MDTARNTTAELDSARAGDHQSAEIAAAMLKASRQLQSFLDRTSCDFGLNETRYTVLKCVDQTAPDGCSQVELAAQLDHAESGISTLIDRMRESGLIYRLRSKSDRRKRVLLLTPLGREVLVELEQKRMQRIMSLLEQFDLSQKRQFVDLLHLLSNELARQETVENAHAEHRNAVPTTELLTKVEAATDGDLISENSPAERRLQNRQTPAA
jgi:DNA-binding MarR family transcriptional regulator